MVSDLWRRAKSGDTGAREALIARYRHLVTQTRLRVARTGAVSAEDLESEGVLGLIKAVDRFDPSRRVKFESYAISAIRGAIREHLRDEDWAPRSYRDRGRELKAAADELARLGIFEPTDTQFAAHLGLTLEGLETLRQRARILSLFSIESLTKNSDPEDPLTILDQIPGSAPDPQAEALEGSEREWLRRAIRWLPETERQVVTLYYYGGETFAKIARRLHRSESRAHQIHYQAIERLAGFLIFHKAPVGSFSA